MRKTNKTPPPPPSEIIAYIPRRDHVNDDSELPLHPNARLDDERPLPQQQQRRRARDRDDWGVLVGFRWYGNCPLGCIERRNVTSGSFPIRVGRLDKLRL